MPVQCLACERISQIKSGSNPYFVAELKTGYVVLGDFQFYRGYTLLLSKKHVTELHDLGSSYRATFLREMGEVAEAVFRAFKPQKLNHELLGNDCPHLHWHIFPRYIDDPLPGKSIYVYDESTRNSEEYRPSEQELARLKEKLLSELKNTASNFT